MNTRIAQIIILLLTTAATSHAQKNSFILHSIWRDSVIVIDGDPSDWDQPFRYFDSKAKIQYSVVNDKRNIYVSLKTSDAKAQMKMLRAGMDVSFDVTGKRKETSTIHFPLKSNPSLDMNPDPDDPEKQVVEHPDVKKLKLDWVMSGKEAKSTGFKGIPNNIGTPDSTNKYGILAAINWDKNDVLTYELKLPFCLFFKDSLIATDTIKPITITVKVNGMDLPMIPTTPAGGASDITAPAGGAGANGGMPSTMNNNSRPQTSSPQPSLAIPQSVADMGIPLIVAMKMRLTYR